MLKYLKIQGKLIDLRFKMLYTIKSTLRHTHGTEMIWVLNIIDNRKCPWTHET